jgi:hypothetical protein
VDDRVREARRRFEDSGAESDEAAWLGACVRTGALDPERLALAAHVGHRAARLVLGQRGELPPPVPWLEALSRWGQPVVVRAAVACARVALSEQNRRLPSDDLPSRWRAVEAAEDWLADPGPLHSAEARLTASFTPDARPDDEPYEPARLGAWTHAALAAAGGWPGRDPAHHAGAAGAYVETHVGAEAVREAVQAALIPLAFQGLDGATRR